MRNAEKKRYVPIVVGACLVILSCLIYMMFADVGEEQKVEEYDIKEMDGVVHVNPGGGMQFPTSPPN